MDISYGAKWFDVMAVPGAGLVAYTRNTAGEVHARFGGGPVWRGPRAQRGKVPNRPGTFRVGVYDVGTGEIKKAEAGIAGMLEVWVPIDPEAQGVAAEHPTLIVDRRNGRCQAVPTGKFEISQTNLFLERSRRGESRIPDGFTTRIPTEDGLGEVEVFVESGARATMAASKAALRLMSGIRSAVRPRMSQPINGQIEESDPLEEAVVRALRHLVRRSETQRLQRV